MNNLQHYGRCTFAEFIEIFQVQEGFGKEVEAEFGRMVATCV